MTRFVSDAIGVRSGRGRSGPTRAERERQLAEFKRTGRHPELDAADQRGPAGLAIPGRLPERVLSRPHAFLDVGPAAGPTRRLVVELFDGGPARSAAAAFLSRCRPGADGGFAGGPLAGIVPSTALFGGGPAPPRAPRPAATNALRHCEPGTVSLSTAGGGFAVALVPLPSLDGSSWAVVGRLTPESLPAAVELGSLPLGAAPGGGGGALPPGAKPPATPLIIRAAGETDARGTHEAVGAAPPAAPESPRTAAARVAAEAEKARAGVASALEAGLAAEQAGGEEKKRGANGGAGRKRGLDELLGGGSESESDSDE